MAKKNLKERLQQKQAELKSRASQGNIVFLKADTTIRVRILCMGEEEEFIKEVIQFYLGSDIKGVISPATFGEPCAIMEGYDELKNSEDEDDNTLGAKFPPRNKYLAFCIFYKDERGKEIDEELSPRFVLLTSGMYQDILGYYLDDEEWGDMTDPINGYDLKLKRTGSGKTDTEYTVAPCKPTKLPKKYNKTYDLEEEVRKLIPTYEKTKELLNKYLGLGDEEEDEDRSRSTKSRSTKSRSTKSRSKKPSSRRRKGSSNEDLPL